MLGFAGLGRVSIGVDAEVELAQAEPVSGDFFSTLGVQPILGRGLTPEDNRPNATPTAVISYGFWGRRFGYDRSVLGKSIAVNGVPFTVAGVAPARFSCLQPSHADDLWIPLAMLPRVGSFIKESSFTQRDNWWVFMVGRLKPGVSEAQARAELNVIFQQSLTPEQRSSLGPGSLPEIDLVSGSKGLEGLRQQFSKPLLVLMSVVALVLLIACANVANLLLARGSARQREIAVRLALGAGRSRLVRQLLTESILLGALGGATGLLLAQWTTSLLITLMSSNGQPLTLNVHTNVRVLAFTAAVSLLTALLFGLAPALQATRLDLAPTLKVSATNAPRPRAHNRFQMGLGKALVLMQVAISLPLLLGAGLFVRTLQNLKEVKLGFDPEHILLFGLDLSQRGDKEFGAPNFYKELLQRLGSLPGVRAVSFSEGILIGGGEWTTGISIPEYVPQPGERMNVHALKVGANFFETMGIPLLVGRTIIPEDTESAPKIAAINEALARRYFHSVNPVGRQFRWHDRPIEIVGLVGDAKYADLTKPAPPTVYFPYPLNEKPAGAVHFEVRTTGNPSALISGVRQIVRELDPHLPLFDVKTQTEQIDETLLQERIFAKLTSGFGLLALVLACVGLYGTLSYAVARRTNEIGIRVALGAQQGQVLWMVLKGALLLVLGGIAIGLPAALAATRLISSHLFGLKSTDPLTICVSILLLVVVGAVASYLPARKASRVDPMVALKHE